MTAMPKISGPANDALDAAGLTTLEAVARAGRTGVAMADDIERGQPRCVGATPGDLAYRRGRVYH